MGLPQARGWRPIASAVAVSLPFLAYFSAPRFADEMRDPYTMTVRYGVNPFKIIAGNLRDVGPFLEMGNVRPLGRIAYSFEFVYSKGLADALGVPLPVVHAIVRTAALWAALAAIASLWTTLESNGLRSRPPWSRTVGLVACAAAAATLATWSYQPLVFFPTQGLFSAALECLAVAMTIRFSALGGRRLAAGCAVLGGMAACFYDLAYVVVVAAPVALGGLRVVQHRARRTRAGWSACIPLFVGFGVVFVPIRLLIVRACAEQSCYRGSDLELTTRALPAFAARLLSALPPTYWPMGVDSWTWWALIIAPVVGLGVAVAALRAANRPRDTAKAHCKVVTEELPRGSDPDDVGIRDGADAAILLVVVMVVAWLTAAAMTALSISIQDVGFAPRSPWRDGIYGVLFLATLMWATMERLARSASPRHLRVAVASLALLVSLQFILNTGTITFSRGLGPNPVYLRVDRLFSEDVGDDEVCQLAVELYELTQEPDTRYYSTALLESMKRLKPVNGCPAYQAPLELDEWHMRQLGDLDS
ncbi:MAG: hypothetical protein R2754_08955 [Microthrixaceae bacterium]